MRDSFAASNGDEVLSLNGKAAAALIDDAAEFGGAFESVPDAMVGVDRGV